jgi:hypothetical protein
MGTSSIFEEGVGIANAVTKNKEIINYINY